MENLKGCGVDQDDGKYDRKSEAYDYSLKYRLNGENSLKRRQSYSDDSDKELVPLPSNFFESRNKRFRANSLSVKDRKNVRLRLGNPSDDSSSNDGAGTMNSARCILDLATTANDGDEDVARDIANKLYEEKDDLMCELRFIRQADDRQQYPIFFHFNFLFSCSASCECLGTRIADQIVQRDTENRKRWRHVDCEWHATSHTGRCIPLFAEKLRRNQQEADERYICGGDTQNHQRAEIIAGSATRPKGGRAEEIVKMRKRFAYVDIAWRLTSGIERFAFTP